MPTLAQCLTEHLLTVGTLLESNSHTKSNSLPQDSMGCEGQPIKLLVLAAGLSSRMGSPKFLLTHPDGRPNYLHTFETLHKACGKAELGFLLLNDPASHRDLNIESLPGLPICPLYHSESKEIRPQQPSPPFRGLLRAFQHDPTAHWLVVPCDYPLMSVGEIQNLLAHNRPPMTCFQNGRGDIEPLVAVWWSSALSLLAENVGDDDHEVDLKAFIGSLGGTIVQPKYGHSFFNTNDKEDWEEAMHLLNSLPK